MAKSWIEITTREQTLLLHALTDFRKSSPNRTRSIDRLTAKLVRADRNPTITVGVHGGQVQWTLGNPFPIRICDYDADDNSELPDIDERGQRCRIWWEPANRSG